MPAMVRLPGKGKKVAWSILGKPVNMQDKKTSSQKKRNEELLSQETTRSR